MWSKPSKHSLVAGAIEGAVATGTLILSSAFAVAIAFPPPAYVQATRFSPVAVESHPTPSPGIVVPGARMRKRAIAYNKE